MNWKKILAAVVLASLGTILLTASKTSLLYMWALKETAPSNQWYATLCLVLLVPEVVSVARALWGSTLLVSGALLHWPSFHVTLLGIFTAILESAAMTFFTLEVASALPVYSVLPLMNVLLLLQILLSQWKPTRKCLQPAVPSHYKEEPVERRVLNCVASAFGLCVFVVLGSMLVVLKVADPAQAVSLVASVIALSVVWCQPVRQHLLCADTSSVATRQNVTLLLGVVKGISTVGFSILTAAVVAVRTENPTVKNPILENPTVETPTHETSTMKISTTGTDRIELEGAPAFLWSGLKQLNDNENLLYALVVHCVANMAACALTRLGAYYTATRSSMVVPTVASTVLASLFFILECTGSLELSIGSLVCPVTNSNIAVLVVSIFLWLIPLMALRKKYFEPADILFRPEIENFLSISYNSVCFDQDLFLNYNPFSIMFGECLPVGGTQSRVFICTTMYREADYEMEQLLRSLSKVSRSKKLKDANVYLESHIFLDNGADGFTLKEFALQLMSLVETCFSVVRAESTIHKTPYGIQITCVLPGGMPLFLHLKDPSLVKAKKRWSQVMYMKYILDHRIKVTADYGDAYKVTTGFGQSAKSGGLSQRSTDFNMTSFSSTSRLVDSSSQLGGSTDTLQFKMTEKESPEEKNNEILVQIRTLLNGLKVDGETKTDNTDKNSTVESRDGSEQSSDQGIDVADEVSTISGASSHRSSQRSNRRETLKPPEDGNTSGSASSTMKPSSSYGSLLSSHFLHGKINPAYVPDDGEEDPPKWLPEFISSKYGGASPLQLEDRDPLSGLQVPSQFEDLSDPVIFSISDGRSMSEDDSAFTSVQMEVPQAPGTYDKQTYILATDADMLFNDMAVLDLVHVCNEDLRLGAACGRTHPMGKKINPIVWYQIFEYAKDFWMIKSAQNVIGSVMCCPGCFSLYRAEAIDDVVQHYSEPTTRAGDVFTKDTGEDRWMCTLMMMRGWKLRYSTYAVNSTYCPDSVGEFIKQRRRWILSDFANSFLVFRNLPRLMRSNGCFSFMYAVYLVQLFVIVIFSPGTTVVMLTVGVELLTGAPYHITTPVLSMIFVLYGLMCCVLKPEVQVRATKFAIVVLGISMAAVVIGAGTYVLIDMIKSIDNGGLSLIEHFLLLALTGSLFYAALLHPSECYILVYGVVYLFYFPAMYMLLPLYALCNIVDQSWGTRDNQKAKVPKLICFPRIRRKKKKKDIKSPSSCENLAEDPDAVSEQLKPLTEEEDRFWGDMVTRLIGKDINLGLNMNDLANGLRKLRNKVVITVMIFNLLWVVGMSFFYLWSFGAGSQISAYGILSGVLYAFSFFIQIVGMTVFRVQDGVHRLGKSIYGKDKPHYIRCVDER